MHAVVCIQLTRGRGTSKSKGDPISCVCRGQDPLESAKMAIVHLLTPEPNEEVEFEYLGQFQCDGRTYALVVDNDLLINWVVYVKEILPSDEVVDLRQHYSGTWTY